ncbi:MAG TPA: class I SAM-dependent rRNA methyltransferase [Anaerolineae bacterium]|nr:class I SAM-dependent rRNA methyltransferase [Anaerolineae bacterium]
MADVYLKTGRDKPVRNHHPWVFSGSIQRITGSAEDGDVVTLRDARGAFLGRGYLNRQSQIVVRLLSWDAEEAIDDAFWERRIAAAVARRAPLQQAPLTTAYRLVYAEADLLPGLIVDRYGDFLVVQCLTLGIDCRREAIVEALSRALSPLGIYERSDVNVREQEGLTPIAGVLAGEPPPPEVEVQEYGHRFLVDVTGGQKTGFYLDQRENRRAVAQVAAGREMLDAFSFTGAFSVYAAAAKAGPIVQLDSSGQALALARRHMALNGFDRPGDTYEEGDVFEVLRLFRDQGRSFDLIVLDPPKFAPTRSHVHRAARAYKDINLLALKLLRPGGILFTFSCSGGVDADLFQKIVFGASVDAEREVQVIGRLSQGPDHPVLLSFPESAYLKGLACRVID